MEPLQTKCILGYTCHTYWAIKKCKTGNQKMRLILSETHNILPSSNYTQTLCQANLLAEKTDKILWLMLVGLALRSVILIFMVPYVT